MTEFGRYCGRIRKLLGLSQFELAQKCGLTMSTICAVEQGRRRGSMETRARIEQELGFNCTFGGWKEAERCKPALS